MSFKQILGAMRQADQDFRLIEDGDRICVGVSGGKDSILLLYALYRYQLIAEKYDHKHFDIVGIHLDMGFGNMDFTEVKEFFSKYNIQYIDYPTKLYDILKLHPDNSGRISCALCSKLKKGAIVKAAQEYNCNKTAFAHHADDAIETLFLNMIYGGKINTFEPAMHLRDTGMDFIRPLIYSFEDSIVSSIKELDLPVVKSTCPNDGYTKRQDVKELLQSIYKVNPQAQHNFLVALSNTEQTKLWVKGKDWQHEKD